MRRTVMTVAGAGLVAVALAACSNGGSAMTTPSPTVIGGGEAECSQGVLSQSAIEVAKDTDPNNTFTTDSVVCDEGWAVVTGILGPQDAPEDGPQGAPTSLVFEAEGPFWLPKNKADVCGTYNPQAPEDVPADALVPAALYVPACLAG